MYNKLKLHEKIGLLLISIETLHTYQSTSLNSSKYDHNLWKYTCSIKHHDYIRYTNIHFFEDYRDTLKTVTNIYRIIKNLYLQEVTLKILKHYLNNYNSILITQYLRRYKYIYQKTQAYYNIKSYYQDICIEHIAIINLYTINQIYNTRGIYFLIKYIYQY